LSSLCPSKAITQLSWRPVEKETLNSIDEMNNETRRSGRELAVASEDGALRIFSLEDLLGENGTIRA
jgi:hypothetical protein